MLNKKSNKSNEIVNKLFFYITSDPSQEEGKENMSQEKIKLLKHYLSI